MRREEKCSFVAAGFYIYLIFLLIKYKVMGVEYTITFGTLLLCI